MVSDSRMQEIRGLVDSWRGFWRTAPPEETTYARDVIAVRDREESIYDMPIEALLEDFE